MRESIEVNFGFSVKYSNGEEVTKTRVNQFDPKGSRNNAWGFGNCAKRSEIIDKALVAGSLVVHVRIRHTKATSPTSLPFIAENPCGRMILNMFMNEDSADVVFEVKEGDQSLTSHVTFHAHRFILNQCAPDLAALCGSGSGFVGYYNILTGLTSVPITGTKPEIFRHMLYYVYGGKVAKEDFKSHAKDIVDAADRFGIVKLKLEAEAWYVKSTTICVGNMMELLYADAKNCALLKEAVHYREWD